MIRIIFIASVLLCGFVLPVFSEETTLPEREKAYVLVPVETSGENTITKFELNPETNKLEPRYYRVDLAKTEYGEGDTKKHYEWTKNAQGNNELIEVLTPTDGKTTITGVYDSNVPQLSRIENFDYSSTPIEGNFINNNGDFKGGAIYNVGEIGDIKGDFIGNNVSSSFSAYGGAISNDGTIGDITGNFIGNQASPGLYVGSYGGAIYNKGAIGDIKGNFIGNNASLGGGALNNLGTIGNITGDFIGNHATSGGALSLNNSGTIGNITGDFIGNYASAANNDRSSFGGAIYNGGKIGDITGDFVGNYASSSMRSYGGAIYNEGGTIGDLSGDFVGNYVSSSGASVTSSSVAFGGAIHNDDSGKIGDITGDFIGNYAFSPTFSQAYGGAIYNLRGTIGNISGSFIGNHTSSNAAFSLGGAIYNLRGTIGNITGDFIGNYASSSSSSSQGGAIYNDDSGKIGDITGDFVGNHASLSVGYHHSSDGGAIYNFGAIGNITGNFIGNYASSEYNAMGGAIFNQNAGTIGNITGNFIGNYVFSSSYFSYGGAIYYYQGLIGEKDADGKITGGIYGSFINNYAKSTSSDKLALGGAVYMAKDLNFIASGKDVLFSGNYTEDYRGKIDNAIFVDTTYSTEDAPVTLTLKAENNGTITFNDRIDGGIVVEDENGKDVIDRTNAYNLKLTGDNSGKIFLNNNVDNAKVTMDTITVNLGKNNVFENSVLTVNSGNLGFINGIAERQVMQSLKVNGNTNLALDVNLAGKTMDTLPDKTIISSDAKIGVNYLNLLNDAASDKTSIFFAPEKYASQVSYTGATPIAYSPIWKYAVSYNPDDGFFTFDRGGSSTGNPSDNYNPSVLPTPVASQAGGFATQMQTFNYAFQHSDNFMSIPNVDRITLRYQNRYALSPTGDATDVGTFSPLFTGHSHSGFWVKPYASFESIPLQNGPKVSNINYGTLIGYDSDFKTIKHGIDRVLTGYIGYNGASQRYSGVDTYQNGGVLGGTVSLYKGNFFNATTLSVGASAGNSNTMYGSENYTMLLAGIGNKTGYNFELKDGRFIIQPSILISYTFVNTFDYRNAAGVQIKSDPLNAIQLAPGLKLIMNTKSGWQPYIGVNMVWNILDTQKVMADNVRLPEMSIRPYVEYGVGVQKCLKEDRMTMYAQAMIHNGGRNGVALSGGLRFKVGKK